MAAGRKNFIFFLCPLDGVRFTYRRAAKHIFKKVKIMLAFPEIICYNKQAVGGIAQLGAQATYLMPPQMFPDS